MEDYDQTWLKTLENDENDENDENQELPDVYGWIEMGDVTSEESMLLNTTSIDMLLRTVYPGSMIALGNTNTHFQSTSNTLPSEPVAAALYIKNNKVGINQVPLDESNLSLTINGDTVMNGNFTWITEKIEDQKNENDIMDAEKINSTKEIQIDSSNILFKSKKPEFDEDQNLILGEKKSI